VLARDLRAVVERFQIGRSIRREEA
jgi:hypothetical protein